MSLGRGAFGERFLIRSHHTRKFEQARVAPGQAVSIYDGLECLGGGIVAGNL